MNTKLGPILTKTNGINFMTKIGLRLGMLVNTPQYLILWHVDMESLKWKSGVFKYLLHTLG